VFNTFVADCSLQSSVVVYEGHGVFGYGVLATQEHFGQPFAFEVWVNERARHHVATVAHTTTDSFLDFVCRACACTGCEIRAVPCPQAYMAANRTHVHAVVAESQENSYHVDLEYTIGVAFVAH
jgi:hypothetical protein